jgi:hypothetical protein
MSKLVVKDLDFVSGKGTFSDTVDCCHKNDEGQQ